MNPDDEVCLCFHVSLRKVRTFLARQNPPVASLVSECLGAGTGCQWCVPFLKHLHACHVAGKPVDLNVSPEQYMNSRLEFHSTSVRDESTLRRALEDDEKPPPT
ncbi:hypothetical protein BH11PLA1_BH11PLA1_13230 [soil metagenome]